MKKKSDKKNPIYWVIGIIILIALFTVIVNYSTIKEEGLEGFLGTLTPRGEIMPGPKELKVVPESQLPFPETIPIPSFKYPPCFKEQLNKVRECLENDENIYICTIKHFEAYARCVLNEKEATNCQEACLGKEFKICVGLALDKVKTCIGSCGDDQCINNCGETMIIDSTDCERVLLDCCYYQCSEEYPNLGACILVEEPVELSA